MDALKKQIIVFSRVIFMTKKKLIYLNSFACRDIYSILIESKVSLAAIIHGLNVRATLTGPRIQVPGRSLFIHVEIDQKSSGSVFQFRGKRCTIVHAFPETGKGTGKETRELASRETSSASYLTKQARQYFIHIIILAR